VYIVYYDIKAGKFMMSFMSSSNSPCGI